MAAVDDDRGQLIVVAGLTIAAILVALVLVLNTVIYTANLASRGSAVDGRAAIEYRVTVADAAGELIDRENDAEHGSYTAVRDDVREGIVRLDGLLTRRHVAAETIAEIDTGGLTVWRGALVRQTDADRDLTAAGGSATWTLARDVEDTRSFALTVGESDLDGDGPSDAFNVTLVGDDGEYWNVSVYDDGGLALSVHNGSQAGTSDGVCASHVTGSEATLDLTAGTVDGAHCDAIRFGKGIDAPYEIRYANGDAAAGTYNLTVNVTGPASIEAGNFDAVGTSPYFVDAVYGVQFGIHFERDRLLFADDLRVAPGEPA